MGPEPGELGVHVDAAGEEDLVCGPQSAVAGEVPDFVPPRRDVFGLDGQVVDVPVDARDEPKDRPLRNLLGVPQLPEERHVPPRRVPLGPVDVSGQTSLGRVGFEIRCRVF